MKDIVIAGVQFNSEYANKEKNLKKIRELCMVNKNKGVDLILFPELCITGFVLDSRIAELAETVPGTSTEYLEKIAQDYKIVISAGLIEICNGLYYNNMVLVGPEGFIGGYRKVHLPFVEYPYYSAGGTFPIYNVLGYKVGFTTCCDNLFSEQFRILAIQGAELILAPFCWLYEGRDSFPLKPKNEPVFHEVDTWIKGHLKKIIEWRSRGNFSLKLRRPELYNKIIESR